MENTLNATSNANTITIQNNDSIKVLAILDQMPKQIKNEILQTSDTPITVNNNNIRTDWHIPYILNGELYEILTQDGENVTVRCCNCPPDRVYRGSIRSTGNFHMHIKRRHPNLLERLHEMKVSAILERRDRFMKNRKIQIAPVTLRYNPMQYLNNSNLNKNSTDKTNNNNNNDDETSIPTTSNGHNLKIKEVFKRHQEAAARNFGELSTININNSNNEPINFSQNECNQIDEDLKKNIEKETIPMRTKSLPEMPTTTKANNNHIQNKAGWMSTPFFTCLEKWPSTILSPISTCDTIIDSSDENNNENAVKRIKAERFEENHKVEAVDLSNKSDSNEVPQIICGMNSLITNSSFSSTDTIDKWLEVDTTLRGIQNELHIRNELERKHLKFEMAKFKFLHPTFNFSQ